MDDERYRNHRAEKVKWYKMNFPERLIESFEGGKLSSEANKIIKQHFS
jgi:hypothetical protein